MGFNSGFKGLTSILVYHKQVRMEEKTEGTSFKKVFCYSPGFLGEDSDSIPVGI